jgi:hypothetical protein
MGSENTNTDIGNQNEIFAWQKKLMLWTIGMPSLLIIVFIAIATIQLNRFNDQITTKNESELNNIIRPALITDTSLSHNSRLNYIKWYSLTKMEEIAMNKRYNQGGLLVMSRVFIKYLGFFTGMILAIVGAVFIISKIKEDVTTISAEFATNAKAALASSSPGIVFGCLGAALMLASILQHTEINVKDMPLYLNQATMMSMGTEDFSESREDMLNQMSLNTDSTEIEKKRKADSIMHHLTNK